MKEDTIPETATEQIEDLEITREAECIDFEIGDNVVYPHHGAGQVIKKEEKEILGEVREYLTIKILHNDMTVMVPCENAGKAGLRRVIDEDTVKKVLAVLSDDVSEMPKNWNRRFKHNRDKIKTGDIYELAEVVRNLAVREQDKGLSTGEKQMYTRAKKILASEMMYALEKTEDEAEAYLDDPAPRRATQLAAAAAVEAPRLGVDGGRAPRGRRQRRTPWRRPAQGVRRAGRPPDARVVARGAARRGDRAVVVALPDGRRDAPAGLRSACAGGATRSESVRAALAAAPADGDAVVVHDAARPLVDRRALRGGARRARRRRLRDRRRAGRPTRSRRPGRTGSWSPTLDRSRLWAIQTPQAFRRAALERALAVGDDVLAQATDDAWLVERAGGRCASWSPAPANLKVTTPARPPDRRAAAC